MAVQLATFGSVFKYKENYFVYFTMTPEGDRVFAAKILDSDLTSDLQRMSRRYEKLPAHPMSGSLTLCFVILSTAEFKGQAATFVGTGDHVSPQDGPAFTFTGKSLDEEDIKELRKTILEDKAVPSLLTKLIKEMDA
jgi:hypothetical protein